MREEMEQQKEVERTAGNQDAMKALLLKRDQEKGVEVREIRGEGFT